MGFPKWVIVYLTLNSSSFIQIFVDLHEVAKNFARATPGTASTERSLKVKGHCAHAFNERLRHYISNPRVRKIGQFTWSRDFFSFKNKYGFISCHTISRIFFSEPQIKIFIFNFLHFLQIE